MRGAEGVLHDEDADVTHVEVDIFGVVEGVGRRGRGSRRCGGEGKDLVVPVLVERLRIGEEEVAGMDVLLDGLEGGDGLGGAGMLGLCRRCSRAARPEMQKASEHDAGL